MGCCSKPSEAPIAEKTKKSCCSDNSKTAEKQNDLQLPSLVPDKSPADIVKQAEEPLKTEEATGCQCCSSNVVNQAPPGTFQLSIHMLI